MKIYLICPVRNASAELTALMAARVAELEAAGHEVHFPPRDADQSDPTGLVICAHHLAAMRAADEVHAFWDPTSTGSHFDLGMAYAMGKTVAWTQLLSPDRTNKSYAKVLLAMAGGDYARPAAGLPFTTKAQGPQPSLPTAVEIEVATSDTPRGADLLAAVARAIPGGCRGILVGWEAHHLTTPTTRGEDAVRGMLTVLAAQLDVRCSHFSVAGEENHDVARTYHGWPELAFPAALAQLGQAAQNGVLALLVSDGADIPTTTRPRLSGVLRLSPGWNGPDAWTEVGYPSLILCHDGGTMSAHELVEAAQRLISALNFPPSPRA